MHKRVWMRTAIGVLIFLVFGCLATCARYQPLPLTQASVEQALTPPPPEALAEQAEKLHHPVLEPLPIRLDDGLSPDEAAVLAVLLNPSLRAARDQRALAGAQVLQAGLLPNPELSFTIEKPVGGDTTGTVNGFGADLGWEISSLVARSARVRAAEEERASVDLGIAWQEWQVALAAKSGVYRLSSLDGQVRLGREVRSDLEANRDTIQKLVRQGMRTSKDLAAAKAALRQADSVLIDLQKQASQQRLALARTLGLPPDSEIQLQEGGELPAHVDPPPAAEIIDGLEQRRLDLIALRHGYESQEAALRAAVLNQFPKISIGPVAGRDVENVDTFGLGISISLPFFDRNQAKIAAEQATRQKLFDEYTSRVFEARSDIDMILDRIHFLNLQISSAQAAAGDLKKLANTYREAMAGGRADIFSYYTVRKDLAETRGKIVALRGELAEALVALELAAGMYGIPEANIEFDDSAKPQGPIP